MPVLKIIAIDGATTSHFGWAIPIVEEAGRMHVMGDTLREGLDLAELSRLAESGQITPVEAVDYEFDEVRERTNLGGIQDRFACRPFDAPVMALYWREPAAAHESIDIKELTAGCTSLKVAQLSDLEIRLLPVSELIVCLRTVVATICRRFVRELADDIHQYTSPFAHEAAPAFANNGRLQSLAHAAYRLAPDRGWAKEAIAQKTLLLMLGDHPASVPAWLASVVPYWGHPSTLEYWEAAAAGVWAAARNAIVGERIAACLESSASNRQTPPEYQTIQKPDSIAELKSIA